jgi:hypothetical protein
MDDSGVLTLDVLAKPIAICRFAPDHPVPEWAWRAEEFLSISRTAQELSITADEDVVPAQTPAQRGYRALKVRGTLSFGLVGIVLQIIEPLGEAGLPVSVVSTHDTDYILVRKGDLDLAAHHLEVAGHHVVR